MGETTNLGLKTYNKNVDADKSFEEYQSELSNPDNSNMTIIDNYLGFIMPNLITALASNSSGSTSNISGSITSASASVGSISTDLTEIGTRFIKLDEFEDSGQADFTSISQDYTHIIIFGVATSTALSGSYAYVSLDFNGDSNTANYAYINWENTGSGTISGITYTNETFAEDTNDGAIAIAKTWQSNYDAIFGNAFLVVIPNYSSASAIDSLYRNAFGISTLHAYNSSTDKVDMSINMMGGYWKSVVPISRIRIFASLGTSTRYNLDIGTKISMYGIL